jgi:hypothetical protein
MKLFSIPTQMSLRAFCYYKSLSGDIVRLVLEGKTLLHDLVNSNERTQSQTEGLWLVCRFI